MGSLRLGVIAAVLLTALGPVPVGAAGGSQAVCIAQFTDTVSPGISLSPAQGAFTSHGQTGTITCLGSVNGHDVTGPGTFGEDGVAQGTCASGSGSALFSMTIPTRAGPVTLHIPAMFTFVGGVGFRPTGPIPGGFVFYPTRGDCVTTPVTEFNVILHGILTT